MSILRRAFAMKTALNFISREVSPYSFSGFRSYRILGGVSIPRPPPSKPHVFFRGFSAISDTNDLSSNSSPGSPNENENQSRFPEKNWFILFDEPEGNPTRDELIDLYVKTLAGAVGSEEEARMRIYSISTRHYFAFGCRATEELINKLNSNPLVRWILPHSYKDPKTKTFGGEPFINGQAVPYDPKYHEEWVRNNSQRSNDRHQKMDRTRNFERRREMRENAQRQQYNNPDDRRY